MAAAIVLENIPFRIDFSQMKQNVQYQPSDEAVAELKQLASSALAAGRPKAVYREALIREKGSDFVIIDELPFHSHILRVNLEPVERVYPYIVTSGKELDEWRQSFAKDELQKYWADIIVEIALHSAVQTLQDRLQKEFNLGAIAGMNPGSLEDWPLGEQPKLFALLGNPQRSIGVRLTESFLMEPVKSVSGIFFENADHYENCRLCTKEGCPGRRATYDPLLYQQKYHSS